MKSGQILHEWIDISLPLQESMVYWPGDPPFEKVMVEEIEKGDSANVSKLILGAHTGTHVDAPRHFIKDGMDVSSLPIDRLVGPARLVEISDTKSITAQELEQHKIIHNERLLFKTYNSCLPGISNNFAADFVALSSDAADYLVKKKVKMVGIDYLSVGLFQDKRGEIHQKLLGNRIGIIEGLDLSKVKAGRYYLVCLPLKIKNGDGAPARAILRPMRTST